VIAWIDRLPWALAFLAAAWLLPRRAQAAGMLVVAAVFLGVEATGSLALLAALGLVTWALGRGLERSTWRVLALLAALATPFVWLKGGVTLGEDLGRVGLRLGMAYYVLRLLHYGLDRYAGRVEPIGLATLYGYAAFLPTLVAGPIHRVEGFRRELRRRRWDAALCATGLERLLYGAVKIAVLGNFLVGVQLAGALEDATLPAWLAAYLGLLRYGANLYLQFSGYSDLAIGLALLAGIRVEENFDWPFFATNINDFWRRWHITLSSWCRDYVFGPVAAVSRNPYLGVVCSMLVLGAWHELSLRYVLWGVYHGLGIAGWQLVQRLKRRGPAVERRPLRWLAAGASWALTLKFVVLSFALTSAPDVRQALATLATILTLEA